VQTSQFKFTKVKSLAGEATKYHSKLGNSQLARKSKSRSPFLTPQFLTTLKWSSFSPWIQTSFRFAYSFTTLSYLVHKSYDVTRINTLFPEHPG
jgi:hypothetical protein